jgi:hypothetical protein
MLNELDRRRSALHLFGIMGFGIAQPLYDLLGPRPAYFVAHGAASLDLVAFALCLSVLLPALAWLAIMPLWSISARVGRAAHLVLLLGCIASFAAQRILLTQSMAKADAGAVFGLAAASALIATAAYVRWKSLRRLISFVSPAAVIFPLLFLLNSATSRLVLPEPPPPHAGVVSDLSVPVVLFILDELPLASLLDEHHDIDAARYPNLARLASGSTWYRNAFSVATYTEKAVPALLTSQIPDRYRPSNWMKYPDNLFTLLGRGKSVVGFETVTRLCPRSICPDRMVPQRFDIRMLNLLADTRVVALHMMLPVSMRTSLPPINGAWKRFGRKHRAFASKESERFILSDPDVAHPEAWKQIRHRSNGGQRRLARFMQLIHEGEPADLFFFHLNLPHGPWIYYPSGQEYGPASYFSHGVNVFGQTWRGEPFEMLQGAQRYLSQLQFADRLVGLVLDEMQHTGLYDRAVFVLTSDHGVSFRAGHHIRALSDDAWSDVLSIPLFVKLPHQRERHIDDRLASILDILPTLADVLGVEIPWPVQGRSLLQADTQPRKTVQAVRLVDKGGAIGGLKRRYPLVEYDPSTLQSQRTEMATFFRSLYVSGREGEGPIAFGPHRHLHGTRIDEIESARTIEASAYSSSLPMLSEADPNARIVPGPVDGYFDEETPIQARTPLAITRDGIVIATTWTYTDNRGVIRFSSLLPENSAKPGPERVRLWALETTNGELLKREIRISPEPN